MSFMKLSGTKASDKRVEPVSTAEVVKHSGLQEEVQAVSYTQKYGREEEERIQHMSV